MVVKTISVLFASCHGNVRLCLWCRTFGDKLRRFSPGITANATFCVSSGCSGPGSFSCISERSSSIIEGRIDIFDLCWQSTLCYSASSDLKACDKTFTKWLFALLRSQYLFFLGKLSISLNSIDSASWFSESLIQTLIINHQFPSERAYSLLCYKLQVFAASNIIFFDVCQSASYNVIFEWKQSNASIQKSV